MLRYYLPNKDKVLLYLDTRELPLERKKEILAAKEQGYQILLATPNLKAYIGYDINHLLEVDLSNFDEARHSIINYIHSNNLNITGVLAWKDREVSLASQLGEDLGLPHTPVDKVENVRNKSKTRELLSSFPGLNPHFAIVTDENSFLSAINEIGVPAVLKQAGNSGSRGMRVIDNMDEALMTYRNCIAFNQEQLGDMYHYYSNTMILEEKLQGSEHSLAGLVVDGQVIPFVVADKKFDRSIHLQYENVIPSQLPTLSQQKIITKLKSAVEATGINWCGFHVDFMITNSGLKVLEIGGRLGGEMINSHLIPLAIPGMNSYKAYIDVAQGINPLTETDYTHRATMRAVSRVITPNSKGKVTNVQGIQSVTKNSMCRDVMQTYGIGDEMVYPNIKFKGYEIGYFIAQFGLSEDVESTINNMSNSISILVE